MANNSSSARYKRGLRTLQREVNGSPNLKRSLGRFRDVNELGIETATREDQRAIFSGLNSIAKKLVINSFSDENAVSCLQHNKCFKV